MAGYGSPARRALALTAGLSQPFTLDITLSGLCLLVRHPRARKLVVLLPPAHAHNGDLPEHRAVLGAHSRYRPEGPFERKRRFFECALADGALAFTGGLKSPHRIALNLAGAEVVDLSEVDNRPPDRCRARLSLEIDRGALCPDCVHDHGATWLFNFKKQRMATRVTWRIRGVRNTWDGLPGVCMESTSSTGARQRFVVRPVKDAAAPDGYRAAFYLYHTPLTELPSHVGHPQGPEAGKTAQTSAEGGELNQHFGAYFHLFDPPLQAALPERVPDEEDEDEGDEDEDAQNLAVADTIGRQDGSSLVPVARFLAPRRAPLPLRSAVAAAFAGYHGRLYTCTVATAEER